MVTKFYWNISENTWKNKVQEVTPVYETEFDSFLPKGMIVYIPGLDYGWPVHEVFVDFKNGPATQYVNLG